MSIVDRSSSQPATHKPPIVTGRDAHPVEDFEALLGSGSDLWADDAEFERFLTELHRWRKQDWDKRRP